MFCLDKYVNLGVQIPRKNRQLAYVKLIDEALHFVLKNPGLVSENELEQEWVIFCTKWRCFLALHKGDICKNAPICFVMRVRLSACNNYGIAQRIYVIRYCSFDKNCQFIPASR